ncbi:hypothetical protein GMORB2_6271 [Geosmithia morbida]|uniref:Uncharacterized protein n=1 Tax=Geosmithia morbida TaxID=1094350 RepID=A0A9P4YVG3_9HYPO|nr:uncharacterized protein GMORB2_6271 [Geosmithia morbida]KAF4123570.1 hypothetical protein GMORB2_6271 [Geosmithia morbida]
MGSFLDAFGDGVSVHDGGISRPKRHRSRSRVSHRHHKTSTTKRSRSRSSSRGRKRGLTSSTSGLGAGLSYLLEDDKDSHKRYSKHNASRGSLLDTFGLGSSAGGGHQHNDGGNHKRYSKHSNASRGSLLDTIGQGLGFGAGGDDSNRLGHHHNQSRSSFFGLGSSRPSYYKRSSRQGYVHRAYKRLKKLLRDLARWAKRHPWKVFFMVIMPLVTGGALTALLARFGLRVPRSLERLIGAASKVYMGNPSGAFGDAVRIAGDFSGSGGGASSSRPSAAAAAAAARPAAGSIGGSLRREYYNPPPVSGAYGSGPGGYGYRSASPMYYNDLAYGQSRDTYSGGGGGSGAWETAANGIAKLFI